MRKGVWVSARILQKTSECAQVCHSEYAARTTLPLDMRLFEQLQAETSSYCHDFPGATRKRPDFAQKVWTHQCRVWLQFGKRASKAAV